MKKMMILLAALAMTTLAVQANEAQPVEMTITSDANTAPAADANKATAEDDKNTTEEAEPRS